MTGEEFAAVLAADGVELDAGQRRCFDAYAQALAEWNARVNLVSRRDLANLFTAHLLPCAAALVHVAFPRDARVADLGSGGGLPGIPLKICRPDLHVTLIDSIRKKCDALRAITTVLASVDARMADVTVVCARAEDLGRTHAAAFDVVTARAVAPLEKLVLWARPLLRPGGCLLAFKGGDVAAEIAHARRRAPVRVEERALTLRAVPALAAAEKNVLIVTWPD